MITGRMTVTVRVVTVRSRGASGGCIFRGQVVDPDGHAREAERYLTVKASYDVVDDVSVGEFWTVTGVVGRYDYTVNGYPRVEDQLVPDTADLICPSGDNIIAALADNPAFKGVGVVLARRLWKEFGNTLYEILDAGREDALGRVLAPEVATNLVEQWRTYGHGLTLRWLDQCKVPRRIARRIVAFYGDGARDKVEEDPYRLIAFEASWSTVDTLARVRFGVAADDPRRLSRSPEVWHGLLSVIWA